MQSYNCSHKSLRLQASAYLHETHAGYQAKLCLQTVTTQSLVFLLVPIWNKFVCLKSETDLHLHFISSYSKELMGVLVNQHVGRIHFFSDEIINNCSPPQRRISLRFPSTCKMLFPDSIVWPIFGKFLRSLGIGKTHE